MAAVPLLGVTAVVGLPIGIGLMLLDFDGVGERIADASLAPFFTTRKAWMRRKVWKMQGKKGQRNRDSVARMKRAAKRRAAEERRRKRRDHIATKGYTLNEVGERSSAANDVGQTSTDAIEVEESSSDATDDVSQTSGGGGHDRETPEQQEYQHVQPRRKS